MTTKKATPESGPWMKWDGTYDKQSYDVWPHDRGSDIVLACWPNAGFMVSKDGSGRQWAPKSVLAVRVSKYQGCTPSPDFEDAEFSPKLLSPPGMAISIDVATHWWDRESNNLLVLDKFYGFSDSGGVWCSRGSDDADTCLKVCSSIFSNNSHPATKFVEVDDYSFSVQDMGSVACSILQTRVLYNHLVELFESEEKLGYETKQLVSDHGCLVYLPEAL